MIGQVTLTFAAYALMIIILWAGAGIAVSAMLKSRPGRQSTKRHRKLYVHTLSEDWGKVK